MEELRKSYIRFNKIVEVSDGIENPGCLLTNDYKQVYIYNENNLMRCKGGTHIILDVGKEICGGIRIGTYWLPDHPKEHWMRIRFGESLMEVNSDVGYKGATNDHAIRDSEYQVTSFSTHEFANTGYRFVRIDFLGDDIQFVIKSITAVSYLRNMKYKGAFECDDKVINDIFNTARYTLHLCMQDYIWDGIKRDRLVWIGDMGPEVLGSTYVFGKTKTIENSIIAAEKNCTLPAWFGALPTYSGWYMIQIADYYYHTGNKKFVEGRVDYINEVIKMFDRSIDENGTINYGNAFPSAQSHPFIDWPSSESKNLSEGNRCLLIYMFKGVADELKEFPLDFERLNKMIARLEKGKKDIAFEEKQLTCFKVLSDEYSAADNFEALTKDGGNGLSTYMSYYILSAIAKHDVKRANEIMKEYYGGMLSLGATSFWEDFDVKWLDNAARIDEYPKEGQKDVHGDYGKYCYLGYRHSFCHGWSCGPVQYVFENIVGIKALEPGYKKVSVKPNLAGLKWISATVPTPYGLINVTVKNGKVKITAPKEIEIVR